MCNSVNKPQYIHICSLAFLLKKKKSYILIDHVFLNFCSKKFLSSSLEHILADFSPTITSLYDSSQRSKHTYNTFSARHIHRSCPDSPYFDANYTPSTHIRNSVCSFQARSHCFSQSKARSDKITWLPLF